jgi:protein-S-isoprenylcysteine O-methyltransferase Ste14
VGFAVQGQGTPAPFDPPQRLVTGWWYTRVRNPIYVGAVLVLPGEALVWQSLALLGYAAGPRHCWRCGAA